MKTYTEVILTMLCAVSGFTFQIQTPAADLQNIKAILSRSHDAYFAALANHRRDLFAGQYTDDCWIMAANMPTLCGPEAAADHYQFLSDSLHVWDGKMITIDLFGYTKDMITEVGFYQFRNEHGTFDDGKYIIVWKKMNGHWKRHRDSFNSNHQPAPQK